MTRNSTQARRASLGRSAPLAVAALCGALAVSGCSALPQVQPAPSTTPGTASPTTAPTTSRPPSPTPSATFALVDPNTATENEIAEALEEHGVPDARRWASAIKANAPYTRDNAMDKLSAIVQSTDLNLLDMGKVNEVFTW